MDTHTEPHSDLRAQREPLPVRTGSYASAALGREQPYTFLTPAEWDGQLTLGSPRYPLLVLLHGRGGNHTNWTQYTRLPRYAAALKVVFACPEGGDGWYTNAFDGSARYEDDLLHDFLPHLQATLPVLPPGKAWGVEGLSMGGFGAVKTALKYPHLFSVGVSHSGAFEKTREAKPHHVFGDPQANAAMRHAENPFALAELAMSRFPTERPRLHLDCGLEDPLLEGNRRFKDHLTFIGYPHSYQEMPGRHTWPYWDRALRMILPVVAQELGASHTE
jgi:S-formylglutathione hydrolase FrmB